MANNGRKEVVDIAKPRYDLETFSGRWAHFLTVTSPLTLFASRASLREAKETVQKTEGAIADAPNRSLPVSREGAQRFWDAKQLCDSSLHPDTGETIPLPFRMSAFVPSNLPIIVGMLTPNPSLTSVIFWQWANQSLNVAVNFSNSNRLVPMSFKEIGVAYAAATSAAVGISVGLGQSLRHLKRVNPGTKALLGRFVPFAAVSTASVVNVAAMRYKELRTGIPVFHQKADGSKEQVGNSAVAGRRAVGMTAVSRILINMPTLILPPLLLSAMQKRRLVPAAGLGARAAEAGLIVVSLFTFLPPAIAAFPQAARIPARDLEERFHTLKDSSGAPITTLYYNKGL